MEVYILVFCIAVAYVCLRSFIRPSQLRKLPPGPTGLPILGSLFHLGSKPHESLTKLAGRYGPLMTLRLGSITTVVATSPEFAREILQKHDQTFSDRSVPDVVAAQPNPEGTLAWVPGDNRWRNRRRICKTQLFTAQRLDYMQDLRADKVQQLMAHIRKKSGTPVDIGSLSFATTINLISTTILSRDIVDSDFDSAQEFKDLIWTIMEDAAKPNVSDYFPIVRRFDLQKLRRHILPSYTRLHEIFDEIIDERLKSRRDQSGSVKKKKGDFLDILLDQFEENGSEYSPKMIKPLILDLFAGSDASSVTTEWAMAELLRKPKAMQKARDEITKKIGSSRRVSESDFDQLPYLQAVVKETLRLHPAVLFLLPYKAGNDIELGGYTISKGTRVLVNAWAIGRDPKNWEDPTEFLPDRFLNSKIDFQGRDFSYIPFGAGRRICPGLPLAIRMVSILLASLIQSFEWALPDGMVAEKLDMQDQFGVTLKKAVPLCAIPTPL